MARMVPILLLTVLWLSTAAFGQSGKPERNLIPVTPAPDESVSGQQVSGSRITPDAPEPPTPAEQMYLFWYLGKIISYPVDTAEKYITTYIRKWREAPKPVPIPASGTSAANPFDSVKWKAIPPAPPVANSSGGGR